MNVGKSPFLLMIATSPDALGRSSTGLALAAATARELGATVHVIDASGWPLVPSGEGSAALDEARAHFARADGALFAGPVYDWAPAPQLLNAVAQIIDSEGPRYKPVALLGGAGTPRSTLALTPVLQMVATEIQAVVVGGPVMVCGDDLSRDPAALRPEVAERIRGLTRALLLHARAFAGGDGE